MTIAGDYLNSGTTWVERGTLKVTGKAENRTGNIIMLDRASVDVTAAVDQTLYILRGSLAGDGTVLGNLSLSRQGATEWAGGGVAAGWGDTTTPFKPGTINVTGNFSMWTGGCLVSLQCNASGVASKLEVAGTAALTGYVSINWEDGYRPALGTTVSFMTCGQRIGSFQTYYTTSPTWVVDGITYWIDFDYYSDVRGIVVSDS